jgi:hypothetical protein
MGGASSTDAGTGGVGTGGAGMGGATTGMGGTGVGGAGVGGTGGTYVPVQVGTTVTTGTNPPMLAAVHISQIGQNIHIELDGTGFGNAPAGGLPAVENLLQFGITDLTAGGWCAGRANANCPVTLQYTTWTDGKIVIDGFGPQYGGNNDRMSPGDQVSIFVQSTTAGAGSVTWTGMIQNEAPPPLDPGGPTPRVASVSFSNIGQNMHIEVAGSGFSTTPVGLPQVTNVLQFGLYDVTRASWCAGRANANCPVTLQYTTWTDGLIVIDGFGPQYAAPDIVAPNDAVLLYIQNAGGPEFMVWSGTLQESPPPGPDPNGPTPRVTSVSFSQIGQNMHVEVAGSGFSTAPTGLPAVTSILPFGLYDITAGGWCAGRANANCAVTLQYTTWTDGLIVIDGFGPQYGGTNIVKTNDAVAIYVQNAHGPEFMVWSDILKESPGPGPDPGGPTPRVMNVTFSQVGAAMHIEVDGSGFGSRPVGVPGTTSILPFGFYDLSASGWCAGRANANCAVTLQYTTWTDTSIVISGFGPQYGGLNQVVSGESVALYVQNSGGPEFQVWSGTLP